MNTRRSGGTGGSNTEHTHVVNEGKPDLYPINKKICHLVKLFPCMYDRSHPQYLKKDAIEKAWDTIASEMEDSVPSCKERWRNIRTSFARSINVRKIPASANRTKPYYLHEELEFLTQHITPGIPVPRRTKKKSSSRYSTSLCDDEESQEVKVSLSEESFDSFVAHARENAESNCHNNVDEDYSNNDEADAEENGSHTNTHSDDISTLGEDNSVSRTSFEPQIANHIKTDNHNNNNNISINNNIDLTSIEKVNLLRTAAGVSAAPLQVQTTNVCPCPPKKRQRHIETTEVIEMQDLSPMVEIEMQGQQQQQQQLAMTTQQQLPQTQTMEPGILNTKSNSSSTVINHNNTSPNIDFDEAFLQGLRPELRAMTFQQKLYFKCRIYDLLKEIYPQSNSLESSGTAGIKANQMPIINTQTTCPGAAPSATSTSLFPTVIVPSDSGDSGCGDTSTDNNNVMMMMNHLDPMSNSTPKAPILTKVNIGEKNYQNATGQTPPQLLMPPRLRAVGRPAQVAMPQSRTIIASANMKSSPPSSLLLMANDQQQLVKEEPMDQSDRN